MKLVEYVNLTIRELVKEKENIVLYGQNINAGSCLSGLTRGFADNTRGLTLNTPNAENTLVGVGFGLMLKGVNSIFFMKQLDFLLLGLDHVVNTYNIIRQMKSNASFVIFPVVVDSGYEGPQASLNTLDDLSSLSGVEVFSFTNKNDSRAILEKKLFYPGFRIISTGQRLLSQPAIDLKIIYQNPELYFFQYTEGDSATVLCFNHSLSYGKSLMEKMAVRGYEISLFSINSHSHFNCKYLSENIERTKKLIIIDDSKSRNRYSDRFLLDILKSTSLNMVKVIVPNLNESIYYPCADELQIDYEELIAEICHRK